VRESWADVAAARETIGYEPEVGFEEGLRRTIEAMLGSGATR
jgi:UDP-glucose 4-epimerase